jgi:hypothetical protein
VTRAASQSDGRPRLRMSLVWNDEVMSDTVVDGPRKVTLGGDKRSTIVIPDLGLPPRFAIVSKRRGGYLLTLADRMAGRISLGGVEHEVALWVRDDASDGYRATSIGGRDWGVIDLDGSGEYRLFFQFVAEDPPLPPSRALRDDDLMLPAFAFAIVLFLILIAVSYRFRVDEDPFIWPGPRALTGSYLVTRIEPEPPPPPPPPAAATGQAPAAPAAAAKTGQVKNVKSATKGEAGKAGGEGEEPRARDPDAVDTPPEPPKVALFEDRNRRVLDNVIQNELQTSLGKFTGLPGPRQRGGVGSGTGKGTGFGPGDGTGTVRGGKGKGPGGGGSVEGDFVSQGKIDTGETRAPKGSGGTGSGVKEVAVVGTGTATGDFGGLSYAEIERVVKSRQGLIRACYQKELNRARGIGGKLAVTFVIGGDGAVKSTRIDAGKSTLRNEAIESCVRTQIARLRFPAKGGSATVNYPFIFQQG